MNLDDLQAIASAATPGPWKAIGGKCLAGVVAPNCQIYLHDARPDMFNSLPRWQATAAHIAAFDPPTVIRLLAIARAAKTYYERYAQDEADDGEYAHAGMPGPYTGCSAQQAADALALRQSLEGVEL